MWFVGLDVHWKRSTYCILDDHGRKVTSRTVHGGWHKVVAELKGMDKTMAVCFEASCGYGHLYEQLSRFARRVVVAHPGQLRLIFRSKRKNDRVDAEKLAKLLFLDEVPPVYVPSAQVRAWRGMIQFRARMVGQLVGAKNRLRALLRSVGLRAPRGLWSRKGMAWLSEQSFGSQLETLQRDVLCEELESLKTKIRRVEKMLDATAGQQPAVAVLRTIPGVGPRTAEAVVAYIDNPDRFTNNKSIGSYFGLVPCQDSSADLDRLGHITRQGPALVRTLVIEATWQAVWLCPQIRAIFERIGRDDPQRRRIAIVATAHYLLRVMHALMRTGQGWRPQQALASVGGRLH